MDENIKIALEKQNPWWFDRPFNSGVERLQYYPSLLKYMKAPEILLLVGARRTGKSTLAFQIIKSLLTKEKKDSILFIDLDEPLFQSKSKDPSFLGNLISECIAERGTKFVFIDEIQNYDYWAQTVKTLYDGQDRLKIVLTGSSSVLLHSIISTKLSGRFFHVKIYPLSFEEFLSFKNIKTPPILERRRFLREYIEFGGFPRVVLEKDKEIRQDLLKSYFQTIYLKDIIYPHNLRNNKDVFELLYYMVSNAGKPFSYTNLAKILHMSVDTVKEYAGYAEESNLIVSIVKFDYSIKKQIINPKKIYCIDTGMINSVSFRFSENIGRLLENLVCLALVKWGKEVYYHREKHECDFIIKERGKIRQAIQVAASLKDSEVRKREIRGLIEAMKEHKLKEGLIITEGESEKLEVDGKIILVKPFYDWVPA